MNHCSLLVSSFIFPFYPIKIKQIGLYLKSLFSFIESFLFILREILNFNHKMLKTSVQKLSVPNSE